MKIKFIYSVALLLAFCSVGYPAEAMLKVKWIWYPENPAVDAVQQSRYFRKIIKIGDNIEKAAIRITADDRLELLAINGNILNKDESKIADEWKIIRNYDLKDYLKKGDNVIVIKVKNTGGYAGLICRGEIVLASGKTIELFSDSDWKVSKVPDKNWDSVDFDDSAWVNASVIGDATVVPWSASMKPDAFMTAEEKMAEKEKRAAFHAKFAVFEKELEKEKKPVVKVGCVKNSPAIMINDKPMPPVFYRTHSNIGVDPTYSRQYENFGKAGINLYAIGFAMNDFWLAPGKYDFSACEDNIRKILAINGSGYILLGVRLEAPGWWIKTNKDELVGYATGDPDPGADQLGRYIAASLASEIWKKETGEAVRSLVKYLENRPVGKRIIGYRVDYGVYTEWHYYGMAGDMPDTGKAMTGRFKKWLREKYSNDVKLLRESWGDTNVSFESATVPSKEERWKFGCMSLRNPSTDKKDLDYYYCHKDAVSECMLYLDGVVKNETQGRLLCGNYYGYFFTMHYPAEGHHLDIEKVLHSSNVDYLCAPYCYDPRSRRIGGDGRSRTICDTYNLHKKLHIVEVDVRTHLAASDGNKYVDDITGSISLIRRDFCNAFIHGLGIYWVDMVVDKPWYDDVEIMNTIKEVQGISLSTIKTDKSSVSEVALVCDPESINYASYPAQPIYIADSLINGVMHELSRTGVPFDTILLSDIKNKELPDYKVYIFLNSFYLEQPKRDMINEVVRKKGKTAVWFYADGFINEKGISEKYISDLTGIKVKYIEEKMQQTIKITNRSHNITKKLEEGYVLPSTVNNGPIFYVEDPSAITLGCIKHDNKDLPGLVVKKSKDWTSIYCSIPFISRHILRGIFNDAGVHQYIDTEDIINVNKSFLSIHTKDGGKKKVVLSSPRKIKELFTKKDIGNNLASFEIEMEPVSTLLFQIE